VITDLCKRFPQWDDTFQRLARRSSELLAQAGSPPAFVQHALTRLPPVRLLFVSTLWVDGADFRSDLATAIGLHMLGVNLIDDIIDRDTDQAVAELAAGFLLLQTGATLLCSHSRSNAVQAELERAYTTIYRAVLDEARRCPDTLKEWHDLALVRGGIVLECYVAVCALASGRTPRPAEREFARALGVVFALRDDVADFWKKAERRGNVIALQRRDQAGRLELKSLVNATCDRALGSLSQDEVGRAHAWLVEEQREFLNARLFSMD
jgi:hypothetical protein